LGGVYRYEEHKLKSIMKKLICLTAGLLALNLAPAFGQAPPGLPGSPSPFPPRPPRYGNAPADSPALTKFSLDFPGGTPSQLVAAIEKAMGKPLNVIINQEDEDIVIPPLKMNDVLMPQLFTALEAVSRKTVAVSTGGGYGGFGSYSQVTTSYGFRTSDSPVSDTSVWYFYVEKPSLPRVISTDKLCQFYSLSDYLNRGFTVDDITTAIQTGWKLAGENSPPELNYHKETKLLIAYGEPSELRTIQQVLDTLPSEKAIRTRADADTMAKQIQKLQEEVDQLKKQASPSVTLPGAEALPAEKSGK
jgi:hypothetical protein